VNLKCPRRQASSRADRDRAYDELAQAAASRYGKGGTFWSNHLAPPRRARDHVRNLERAQPPGSVVSGAATRRLRRDVRRRRARSMEWTPGPPS
jgi:hypothetical protein